jgi:RimJ/RimL family protein N-acetyltransferase
MTNPTDRFDLHQLTEADAERYNDYFSRGTIAHPLTLRISASDISSAPFGTAPTDDRQTIAAVRDKAWLGVGTIEREAGRLKRRHIAWVVRMLVTVERQGIGRSILRELKRRARLMAGIGKINLTVAANNTAAVHLYQSEGFSIFSREFDAFRVDGQSVEEFTMSCPVSIT